MVVPSTSEIPELLLPSVGFPDGSVVKNPPTNAGDAGSIPGSGRSPGDGNGNHSSILAWRIPWMEELGGLQSTGCKESDTTERLHFHLIYNILLVQVNIEVIQLYIIYVFPIFFFPR